MKKQLTVILLLLISWQSYSQSPEKPIENHSKPWFVGVNVTTAFVLQAHHWDNLVVPGVLAKKSYEHFKLRAGLNFMPLSSGPDNKGYTNAESIEGSGHTLSLSFGLERRVTQWRSFHPYVVVEMLLTNMHSDLNHTKSIAENNYREVENFIGAGGSFIGGLEYNIGDHFSAAFELKPSLSLYRVSGEQTKSDQSVTQNPTNFMIDMRILPLSFVLGYRF